MKTLTLNSNINQSALIGCLLTLINIFATVTNGQRQDFFSMETGVSFVRSHTKDFGTLRLHKPYVNFSSPFIHVSAKYGQSFQLNKFLDLKCAVGLDYGGYRYRIYRYAARDSYNVGRSQVFATLLIQSVIDPHIFDKNILKYGIGLQLFGNLIGFWKDGSSYDYFADASIHPLMIAPRFDVSCDLGHAVYSLSLMHSITPLLSTSIRNNYLIVISIGIKYKL